MAGDVNLSAVREKNKLISQISNTNNPSQNYMGKDAQTKFKVGQQIYSRLTNNFNLSKNFAALPSNINLLNIQFWTQSAQRSAKDARKKEKPHSKYRRRRRVDFICKATSKGNLTWFSFM